jgi:hypothetical protein
LISIIAAQYTEDILDEEPDSIYYVDSFDENTATNIDFLQE